jgi:hypothetical protein
MKALIKAMALLAALMAMSARFIWSSMIIQPVTFFLENPR